MTTLLILAALCHQPASAPVRDHVAAIEDNRMYDGEGRFVFRQVIFWATDLPYPNTVRQWRMYDKIGEQPRYKDGQWTLRWLDDGVLREVRAESFYETWTQHDPEVENREIVPQDQRVTFGPPQAYVPNRPPFVIETPAETP